MAIVSLEDLLRCVAVAEHAPGRFAAPNLPRPEGRLYGGQLLAQMLAIAARAGGGKRVKSLHASFAREGDPAEPVDFRVERLHEGRSFASVCVRGAQKRGLIASALASLHAEESGLEHQLDAPSVGAPRDAEPVDLAMIPWEVRVVGGVDLSSEAVGPPRLEFWMRAPALPADPALHQALLALATDLTVIETALRPHAGVSAAHWPDRLQSAVTSHTVWFHRPLRLDTWLLLAQESPVAAGARGFGVGHVFTRAGRLVASYAQESLIRVRRVEPPGEDSA